MPSPVGHTIAGLIVHVLCARDDSQLGSWRRAGVVVGAALAPDLDLALRLADGRNHHQAESHSLGCALLFGALAAVVLRRLRWSDWPRLSIAVGLAWVSHVLLDYLNRDTNPPIGLMALWPLSDAYYKFPWPVFLDVGRTLEWATLRNNLVAAAWEVAVLLPLLSLAWRWRDRRRG